MACLELKRRVWIIHYGRLGSTDYQPYDELPDLSGLPRLLGCCPGPYTTEKTEPSAANTPPAGDGHEVLRCAEQADFDTSAGE